MVLNRYGIILFSALLLQAFLFTTDSVCAHSPNVAYTAGPMYIGMESGRVEASGSTREDIRSMEIPGTVSLSSESVRIVTGEQNRTLANRLSEELERRAGVRIPVLSDEDLNNAIWGDYDLILIGNFSDNRAVERLYIHYQTFVDAAFPGQGGHSVKTRYNPFGTERSVIILAGSDQGGHFRSADRFLQMVDRYGRQLPPLHSVESELLPSPAPGPDEAERILEQNRHNWEIASGNSSIMNAIRYGLNYHFSNDPVWVYLYMQTLMDYIERAETAGDWMFAPRTGTYFQMMPIVLSWDLIEYSPEISEEERERVRAALFDIAQYVAEIPYLTDWANPAGEPRQNHTTFATLSLDASLRYFARIGMLDEETQQKWREITDHIFEGQLRTYRPDDDAGNYAWYGAQHVFGYMLRWDDDRAFQNGLMDLNADLAITVFDNRRDEVSFGDVRTYIPWDRHPWPRPATILSMAWWAHGDPAHAWAYQWLTEDKKPPLGFQMPLNTTLMKAPMPEVRTPPERFLGLKAIRFDEALVEFIASRVMNPRWIPRQGRPYYDKLSFRHSFDPMDEYMLLDGTSAFAHGHDDGNAILRLTWLDRIWLADLDIIRTMPRYHNMIEIARNGATEVPPPMNELTIKSDLGSVGLVRSDMKDYTGMNWARNILWRKGEYFVVIDHLEAQEPGEYDLRGRWRVLGEPSLEERTFTVSQPDAIFQVVNADDSRFEFEEEEPGQSDWSRYPHAEPVVTTWVQRREQRLSAGESVSFMNLLYARPEGDQPDLRLKQISEGLALLEGEGRGPRLVGVAPELRETGNLAIRSALFEAGEREIFSAGLTFLETAEGILASGRPVDLRLQEGEGELRVYEETSVRVSGPWSVKGVSDGTVVLEKGEFELQGPARVVDRQTADRAVALATVPPTDVERWTTFGLTGETIGEMGARVAVMDRLAGTDEQGWLLGSKNGQIAKLLSSGTLTNFASIEGSADAIAQVGSGENRVILTGGDEGRLQAFGPAGDVLWDYQLGVNRSRLEEIRYLRPHQSRDGEQFVAGTLSQRVHAFSPAGDRRWVTELRYWAVTALETADLDGDGAEEIIAGMEYLANLNLLDDDGTRLWYAWEQTGSEANSTTEKVGTHTREVLGSYLESGSPPVVILGTETNEVFVMTAEHGEVLWRSAVGGAVNGLFAEDFTGDGNREVLVGDSGGYLRLLDYRGREIWRRSLDGSIATVDVVYHERIGKPLIAAGTRHGLVTVFDPNGDLFAAGYTEGEVHQIRFADGESGDLVTVSGDRGAIRHWELRLPRSAFGPQYRTGRHRY